MHDVYCTIYWIPPADWSPVKYHILSLLKLESYANMQVRDCKSRFKIKMFSIKKPPHIQIKFLLDQTFLGVPNMQEV